jgi:hypothetical protein
VDSDGDRPAELAGLDGAEPDELLPAAPSGPAGAAAGSGPVVGPGFAEGGVLDALAPGVALAGFAEDAHAGLAGLTDDELVGVLRAWARQESWGQARKLAAVAELARRRPAEDTPPASPGQFPASLSEFTADEVGLALTLTRRSAVAQLDLAGADRPAGHRGPAGGGGDRPAEGAGHHRWHRRAYRGARGCGGGHRLAGGARDHERAAARRRAPRARPVRARSVRAQLARGHPARGQPVPGHPADGWTITLTTERIAGGQSP